MDSMVDPSGEFLFESVQEISDEHGVTQKAPQTEEEWAEVRHRAVTLLEAPNLLVMPGRRVAHPDEKPERREIELAPERIQQLIDGDRVSFINRAKDLQGNRQLRIILQGNTDERGTREYNIALGQRRADAVKKLMILLGASEVQIETVSFGKEKPKIVGHYEQAWSQNRRSDIVFR